MAADDDIPWRATEPGGTSDRPHRRRRVLAVAAGVVAAGGLAAAAVSSLAGTDAAEGPVDVSVGPAADRAGSTTTATTAIDGATTTATTAIDGAPTGPAAIGRVVGPGGASYSAIWYPGWTTANLPPATEALTVTDGEAHIGSIAPTAGDLLQLWVVYDDGVVELQAAGMTRDELIAAGNGVRRTPGTDDVALTPPDGFTTEAGSP
jgi:hypothetical protein